MSRHRLTLAVKAHTLDEARDLARPLAAAYFSPTTTHRVVRTSASPVSPRTIIEAATGDLPILLVTLVIEGVFEYDDDRDGDNEDDEDDDGI